MPAPPIHHPPTLEVLKSMTADDWRAAIEGERTLSLQWMEAASHLGSADAQVVYGQWCLDGHGRAPDAVVARASFLKSAMQAHPMGMNMAGRCFENGWGGDVDHFAAANWYRQAAHKGLVAGMYNYANLLVAGQGVRKDASASLDWYRRAARTGYAKSMTKIGHFYEDGRVVRRDADLAFAWFEKGALGGDFRGQFNYASMLAERGRLVEALHWLRKVPLTATQGYKRLAGEKLLMSPNAEFQAIGRLMLEDVKRIRMCANSYQKDSI